MTSFRACDVTVPIMWRHPSRIIDPASAMYRSLLPPGSASVVSIA